MPKAANKVKFGLKNVHYAKITDTGTALTFATPKRLRGAVNLSLSANGELVEFSADDIVYWSAEINNGYDGELEIADLPDEFAQEILGEEIIDGIAYESANQKGSKFAILFEVNGDEHNRRYVYYYCAATRPSVEAATKEGSSVSPSTSKLTFQARPHIYNELIKANTTKDTAEAKFNSWFTEVHEKPTTPVEE